MTAKMHSGKLKFLFLGLCLAAALFVLASCGELNPGETPHEHNWVNATCTEAKHCSRCEATEGNALGHDWVNAACTEAKHCSRCEATDGNALGHDWIDATCTEPKHCSRCEATDGNALGHDWTAATCTELRHCSRCELSDGNALGHDWKNGFCSVCGVREPSEGLQYQKNFDGTAYTVIGIGTCSDTDIVIPEEYMGLLVTSIGDKAFYNCTSLTSITIPDSVTSIGSFAFSGCTILTNIAIPDSMTNIGNSAFYDTAYYNNYSNWENGVLYIGSCLIEAKSTISGKYTIKTGTKCIADSAINSERDFRKTQQKIQNNIENSLQMIA